VARSGEDAGLALLLLGLEVEVRGIVVDATQPLVDFVEKRMASPSVVFPEPPWPTSATFRISFAA